MVSVGYRRLYINFDENLL